MCLACTCMQAALETKLAYEQEKTRKYEAGVYGLPQAVEEIRGLQSALSKEEARRTELVSACAEQPLCCLWGGRLNHAQSLCCSCTL